MRTFLFPWIAAFVLLMVLWQPVQAKSTSPTVPSYTLIEAFVNTRTSFNGHYLIQSAQELGDVQLKQIARQLKKKYSRYRVVVVHLWNDASAYREYKNLMDPGKADVASDDYWVKYDKLVQHLVISYEKNKNTGQETLLIQGKEVRPSSL